MMASGEIRLSTTTSRRMPVLAQRQNPACNAAQAVSFIQAHQADAATVAQQLGVPTQNVLGLSGIESQWGTSNAARSANNFFGLHGGSNAPFANGSWYTSGGVQMSSFPSYLASAQSFAAQYGPGVSGISNPTAFAQALVSGWVQSSNSAARQSEFCGRYGEHYQYDSNKDAAMWSIVPCLLLTSAALAAGEGPKIVIHVTTSDAVKVAQMIAKDEGYDITNDRLYYFDLLESQGQPLLRGYTSVGFYINGNIRSTLSISETTGQVIDMNSCEVWS